MASASLAHVAHLSSMSGCTIVLHAARQKGKPPEPAALACARILYGLIGSVWISVHSSALPVGIGGREGSWLLEGSLFETYSWLYVSVITCKNKCAAQCISTQIRLTNRFVGLTLTPTAALRTDTGFFSRVHHVTFVSFSLSSLLCRFGEFCVGLVEMFGRWF